MFSDHDRHQLRAALIQRAHADDTVVAAALVGSAARGSEDQWSDIDLALCISAECSVDAVADAWTAWFRSRLAVADTFDLRAGGGLYRVFLGASSLQVDLSFFPPEHFGGKNGEPMRLLFGDSNAAQPATEFDWRSAARMGWLHALHARSAIGRNRQLQADMMLAELRHGIIAIAGARLRNNPHNGRSAHALPGDLSSALMRARPADLAPDELRRSLRATCAVYLDEISRNDADFAAELAPALATLVQSVR